MRELHHRFGRGLSFAKLTQTPACRLDDEFLARLHANVREAELSAAGLSESKKSQLLEIQFGAQTRHLKSYFPNAVDRIIRVDGRPIGRLVVDHKAGEYRVVDMALLTGEHNKGYGAAMIRGLQAEASDENACIRLAVVKTNRAVRLYQRLGFQFTSDTVTHWEMEWSPHHETDRERPTLPVN
jgi:ribosomal protein S18 acetylase RimI-like enzyme